MNNIIMSVENMKTKLRDLNGEKSNKKDLIDILNRYYKGFDNLAHYMSFNMYESINYKGDNSLSHNQKQEVIRYQTDRNFVLQIIDSIENTGKVKLDPGLGIFYVAYKLLGQDRLSDITKSIFENFIDIARLELKQNKGIIKIDDFTISLNKLGCGMNKKRKLSTITKEILPKEIFSENTRRQLELFFEKAYDDLHTATQIN